MNTTPEPAMRLRRPHRRRDGADALDLAGHRQARLERLDDLVYRELTGQL